MTNRRDRRKDRIRRALLDSALALFAERGLGSTRVEDVTERVDLGKGAFYNYFESKDALVAALVAEGVERLDRDYLPPPGSATTDIAALARPYQQFFDEHPLYLLLFHQARGLLHLKPGASSRLREVFREHLLQLAQRLGPAVHREATSLGTDLDLAAVVAGALSGEMSFRIAAGLPPDGALATDLLVSGLPALRKHAPGSSAARSSAEGAVARGRSRRPTVAATPASPRRPAAAGGRAGSARVRRRVP